MADPFFNAAYYLAHNSDVAAAGYTLATAEQHYLRYGATEGRTPNTWFNAAAYLAAYPDLASHGVTTATAFQHYITYGINEGRSPAANVSPANFSYADYATANPDLKTAFGITDPTHLTADQQHQLFGHFLSFGYLENRPGIVSTDGNSFFAQFDHTPVQSGPPAPPAGMNIAVDGSHVDHIYTGAGGDDVFTGEAVFVNGTTLNGAGGNDTLNVNFNLPTGGTVATANSIEKINVDFGNFPMPTQLTVQTADTPSLSITVKGGFFFPSLLNVVSGDAALHTLTVDGSLANGDLNLNLTSSTLAGVDVTLTGGAGNDTFSTAVGAGHKATLNGGAGNDNLRASLGVDTLTGDDGQDTFDFSATPGAGLIHLDGGGAIATTDIVADFQSGDILSFTSGSAVTSGPLGALGNVDTVGVLTYTPLPGGSLTETVAAIDAAAGSNSNLLFMHGTDTYFLNTGVSPILLNDDTLIKLTGVDITKLTADANGVHYTLAT